MAMGRPPQPVPADKVEEIIVWISEGKPLREYCRIQGNPAFRTVYDWLEKDENFAARFAHARDIGGDVIAEEGLAILDTFPMSTAMGSIDSAHVSWLKNRFEGRLKLLAKWNPKKYGEKSSVELTGADGGPVKVEDTQRSARIAQLLATAKTRKLEEEDFGDLA